MEQYDRILDFIDEQREPLSKEQELELLQKLMYAINLRREAVKRDLDRTPSIVEE